MPDLIATLGDAASLAITLPAPRFHASIKADAFGNQTIQTPAPDFHATGTKFARMVSGQTLVLRPDSVGDIVLLPPTNAGEGTVWGATLDNDLGGRATFDLDGYGGPSLSEYILNLQDDSIWFYLAHGRIKIYRRSIQQRTFPRFVIGTGNPTQSISESAPSISLNVELHNLAQPSPAELPGIIQFALDNGETY